MKKKIMTILVAGMCLSGAMLGSACAVNAVDSREVSADSPMAGIEDIEHKETLMTQNFLVSEFTRERAVLDGELSPDTPRLTLAEVQKIIDNSDSINDILNKLVGIQPPDVNGGSGITFIQYWFDERGSERINLTIPDGDVVYLRISEEGIVLEEKVLYSTNGNYSQKEIGKRDISYAICNELDEFADDYREDSVNINEVTKEKFRVYELYSDEFTKPERRLVKDFRSIMRVYNVPIRGAFNKNFKSIDDVMANNVLSKYYLVEAEDGSINFYDEKLKELKSNRSTIVNGETVPLPALDIPEKALERFQDGDFVKKYISPNAKLENIYYLSGETSMMGTAIYYKTSVGDYVYYNYYSIGEKLFPVAEFCKFQQAVSDEYAKYPESNSGGFAPSLYPDIDKYELKTDSAVISSIKGDANCDQNVNMSDAVIIMQAIANPDKYGESGTDKNHITAQGKENADMDGDGLTVGDALAVQKKLLKIDEPAHSESDYPAMIMVGGKLYVMTNEECDIDISDTSLEIKKVTSYNDSGVPQKDGETNFDKGCYSSYVVRKDGNVAVQMPPYTNAFYKFVIFKPAKEESQPVTPTVSTLAFKTVDELVDALKNYSPDDFIYYNYDGYEKMYEKIIGDGYAYCFAGDGINLRDDHPNAPIFLMPYGRYEDIGILYHVNYKGRDYQIYYYSKDTAYQTNDINKYISQRFGFDNVKMVNDKYAVIHGGVDSTPEVSAFFDLDKGHYCKVRTFGTENELMEILNVLDRKKLYLHETDNSVAGKVYVYEKEGMGGDFTIYLDENGTFTYYEGCLSSYIGSGTWEVSDDILTLNSVDDKKIHLRIDGDDLVYIADGSEQFYYTKVNDGDRFSNSDYKITVDWFCDGKDLAENVWDNIENDNSAVIESTEQLKKYLSSFCSESRTAAYLEKYNDEYFIDKVLLMNAIYQGGGTSPRYTIDVMKNGDKYSINARRNYDGVEACIVSMCFAQVSVPRVIFQNHTVEWTIS